MCVGLFGIIIDLGVWNIKGMGVVDVGGETRFIEQYYFHLASACLQTHCVHRHVDFHNILASVLDLWLNFYSIADIVKFILAAGPHEEISCQWSKSLDTPAKPARETACVLVDLLQDRFLVELHKGFLTTSASDFADFTT